MISSVATRSLSANGAPYNMGKAALEALAATLAKEVHGDGIFVNTVCTGIGLSLEVEAGLGDMRADQRKIKQIMLNLLSNAVKFTPDGGHITVHARLNGDVLEVAVTDTGIGIAPADQDTVFEEFRQAGGSYSNKQEGTGLGLALTRRFVELHGGSMGLQSAPGQGSTFTFTIPRQ